MKSKALTYFKKKQKTSIKVSPKYNDGYVFFYFIRKIPKKTPIDDT